MSLPGKSSPFCESIWRPSRFRDSLRTLQPVKQFQGRRQTTNGLYSEYHGILRRKRKQGDLNYKQMLLTLVGEQTGFGMFQKRNNMSRSSEAGVGRAHLEKGQKT